MSDKNNNTNNLDLIHRKRTLCRLMAVQIFYQYEFLQQKDELKISLKKSYEDLIDNYAITNKDQIKSYRDQVDENLIKELVNGVELSKSTFDDDIKSLLSDDLKTEKLENLLWQILRFGAFELKFSSKTALKIILNEYIDITSFFFPKKQVKFVNSVLENLAKKYRQDEFLTIKKSV